MKLLPTSVVAILLAAPAAIAADAPTYTYEEFESSVVHLDLETCPDALAAEGVFCRASVANEAVHVYAFSEIGDLPMVGFMSYEEGEFEISFK